MSHFQVTPLQEGMLINQQLNPGLGFDLEQVVVTFPFGLHPDRFVQSFRAVADRHPALRSHFRWDDAGPVQVIDEHLIVASPIVDWSANPEAALNHYLATDRRAVMDTTTTPLHRLIVARTNAETWTLVWSFPHALLDGRSIVIVLDDWFALAADQTLGPAPTDFATFARYVRARESQIDHAFWRERLASFRAPTPLPAPFVPPAEVTPGAFGQVQKRLDRTQTAALLAVATAHGATMNNCVQAALAITLGRYAREDHVVFGNVRACRHTPVPGAESQVGLLMNTLPFSVGLAAVQTVGELLAKLRSEQRDHAQHELDNLIAVQSNSQVPLGTPLFHVILMFESADFISSLRRRNTEWNHRQVRVISRPNTPLTLEANGGDELKLNFIYDATRWDAAFAEQVLTLLITTLTRFITQPQARLAEISLAEPAWLSFLENTYNATQWTHPNLGVRLHDLLWAQSLRTPNALALVGGDVRLTHLNLCQQAARLARILQQRGVSRSTPVGIFAEHGPVGVLSALAIMMAGGTYVPLDPTHPPDRLAWILASAGCQLLMTHRGHSSVLGTIPAELIDLDTINLEHGEATLPHCPATLDDPAYIIYTSGSTGRPKGVVISHRAVVNTIIDLNERFVVTATDRVLALSSATFDLSVYDAFGVLAAGGAAIFPVGTALRHPPAWLELMASERVTMWDTVPALMEMLLPFVEKNISALATLRLAMFSGDWIAVTLPGRLRALAPHCQVFSLGGATEGSIWSILHPTDQLNLRAPSIPYGGPLRNQTMHVLDDALEPCPPLIPGEIAIGGVGVALGYWKDPQRTAERFVTHPRSGKRLYRTGDLGRHLPDGTIEFLGRIDHQVKIRGYRVELGEVEAALATHPAVQSCVVAACGDRKVAMRLVAYVVLKPTMTIDLDSVTMHTGKMIPPYMVPEALVTIDALPLSPNGKVDRNRLPAPALIANQNTYIPPMGETEQRLAELWSKLLGVEKVGANDDFFALGGHSLLAGRLMAQWSHVSPVVMELRDVFEARTPRSLAQRLSQRSTLATPIADPLLIAASLRRGAATMSYRGGDVSVFPASSAQERIFFIELLTPGTTAYTILVGIRLSGLLVLEALRRGVEQVVARHEALRTVFINSDGGLLQAILPPMPVPLPVTDLSALPIAEQQGSLDVLARQEAARPFDLGQGPLARFQLVRFAADDHALLTTVHHAICDGMSLSVLFREWSVIYNGKEIDPVALQQADVAAWQKAHLSEAERQRQQTYWRTQLAGARTLDLPTDRPRPAEQHYRGAIHQSVISGDLVHGLRHITSRAGATTFMGLMTAFQVLLARYAGQEDVTVGVPVSGRTAPGVEHVIGMLINMLPIRIDLSGAPTLMTVLERVRDAQVAAFAHQDLPFEAIVEAADVPRDLSRSPVFQAMIGFQDNPVVGLQFHDLKTSTFAIDSGTAKVDLTLYLEQLDDHIAVLWEYDRDLFDLDTIVRFDRHFQALLRALSETPDVPVAAVSLLSADERQQILIAWNATHSAYPSDRCVHHLIEEQATQNPERIAVIAGNDQLTYRELARQVSVLASYLRAQGIGPGSRVAVCVPRTTQLPVALLGALAAGAAYVPLDSRYPATRIAQIIEDSQPALVLTQADEWQPFATAKLPIFNLDAGWEHRSTHITTEKQRAPTPDDIAYVIYTSGSTGRPKGVQIPHRAAVNFLCAMRANPGITAQDRLVAVTTISFDIAVLELFAPLTTGATVVIADRDTAADGHLLAALLETTRATIFQATPVTMRLLLEAGWRGDPHIKLLCGGEALSRELANRLLPRCAALWNMYGPTETTVWSSADRVDSGDGPVFIGTPIANTRFHILDHSMTPQPIGVSGDLYIGGDGLAHGYVNLADQTAARFIADPFHSDAKIKLYATGDVARYRPDGRIEFLGRSDHQVKIRGFRIELGEIENALMQQTTVRECAVVARGEGQDTQLIAYVVLKDHNGLDADHLRVALLEKLPSYMIPSAFVPLEKLPLTANGKLDRKTLPAPNFTNRTTTTEPPTTPTEKLIANIWTELLGVTVNRNDDFFALGGHSLTAGKVMAKWKHIAHIPMEMRDVFEARTLRDLALLLDQRSTLATPIADPLLVTVQPKGKRRPFFFIGGFLDVARHLGDDRPVHALDWPAERKTTKITFADIAVQCVASMRRVQPTGPYQLGGHCFGATVAFAIANLLESQGERTSFLVLLDPPDPTFRSGKNRLNDRVRYHLGKLLNHSSPWSAMAYLWQRITNVRRRTLNTVRGEDGSDVYRDFSPKIFPGSAVIVLAKDTFLSERPEDDPRMEWRSWVRDGVELIESPGDHVTFCREPLVEALGRQLAARMDATD